MWLLRDGLLMQRFLSATSGHGGLVLVQGRNKVLPSLPGVLAWRVVVCGAVWCCNVACGVLCCIDLLCGDV